MPNPKPEQAFTIDYYFVIILLNLTVNSLKNQKSVEPLRDMIIAH